MQTETDAVDIPPQERVYAGWIHAFGLYQPRWQIARHLNSTWSQSVMRAKRKSETAIESFGRVISAHLVNVLPGGAEYVITHVPAEEDRTLYLFVEFGKCATELLAEAIHGYLREKLAVRAATLLVQVGPKTRKQHQCVTDAQRAENVRGIYMVNNPDQVAGKGVILVDDILTSGATMHECARALRGAGAASVIGVALARTERLRGPVHASAWDSWPGGDAA